MTDERTTVDHQAAPIVTEVRCAACADQAAGERAKPGKVRLVATLRATAAGGILVAPRRSDRHHLRKAYGTAELDLEDALEEDGTLDTELERTGELEVLLLDSPIEPIVVCRDHGRLEADLDLLRAAYTARRPTITLTPHNAA